MKALVAAKDEIIRETRQSLSSDKRWYILEVESSDELMYGLNSENPELIVIDIQSVDVKSILERIRPQFNEFKVLFIGEQSDLFEKNIIRNFLKPGQTDYIIKPFDSDLLKHRIYTLLFNSTTDSEFSKTRIQFPSLHDKNTGRIDAVKIADKLGISLKQLSKALNKNYRTVHKTPHSENIQDDLATYKRIIEILYELFEKEEDVNIWLNSPSIDFGNRTPVSIIKEGHADAVLDLLNDILEGSAT